MKNCKSNSFREDYETMSREKVIKELTNLPTTIYDGFYQLRITHDLRDEIVKLLKEQEAKTVIEIAKRFNDCDLTGFCPFCSRPLIKDWAEKYCGYCGNPVLWEGR